MKCAYQNAAAIQRRTDVCSHLGERWLDYVEALTVVSVHRVLGWGRRRIRELQNGSALMLDDQMTRYSAEGEDIWETTQTADIGMRRNLAGLGFDLRELNRNIPIPDDFCELWHREKIEVHRMRLSWIETMETKLNVYYASLMLWIRERDGIGAVRMQRLCEDMRRQYVRFAGLYLRCEERHDREMVRMIDKVVKEACRIMAVEEDEPGDFVPVEEFIAKMKRR